MASKPAVSARLIPAERYVSSIRLLGGMDSHTLDPANLEVLNILESHGFGWCMVFIPLDSTLVPRQQLQRPSISGIDSQVRTHHPAIHQPP